MIKEPGTSSRVSQLTKKSAIIAGYFSNINQLFFYTTYDSLEIMKSVIPNIIVTRNIVTENTVRLHRNLYFNEQPQNIGLIIWTRHGFFEGDHLLAARGVSENRDGEDLWQWSRLEIRLNAFRRSTIPQKQFINSKQFNSFIHVALDKIRADILQLQRNGTENGSANIKEILKKVLSTSSSSAPKYVVLQVTPLKFKRWLRKI